MSTAAVSVQAPNRDLEIVAKNFVAGGAFAFCILLFSHVNWATFFFISYLLMSSRIHRALRYKRLQQTFECMLICVEISFH